MIHSYSMNPEFHDQLSLGNTTHCISLLEMLVFIGTRKILRSPCSKGTSVSSTYLIKVLLSQYCPRPPEGPGAPWITGGKTSR